MHESVKRRTTRMIILEHLSFFTFLNDCEGEMEFRRGVGSKILVKNDSCSQTGEINVASGDQELNRQNIWKENEKEDEDQENQGKKNLQEQNKEKDQK